MRTLALVAIAASVHVATTLVLGVTAFIAQGNITDPGPPSFFYTVTSAVVDVLEFPLVSAVRKVDPERLSGFTPAAAVNSLLWGVVCCAIWRLTRRRRAE